MTLPGGIDLQHADAAEDLFRAAAEAMRISECRQGSVDQLPGVGRLLLSGDLHDHLDHLQRITHLADLGGSSSHHVLLQELIHGDRLVNGLDFSFRMLARVASMVLDFPGQVHPVLGNHELAQYTRRPVSKGAGNSVELFEAGVEWAFGDETEIVLDAIDAFFAAMPLAVRTESGLLCTHSLPDAARMESFDPGLLERVPVEEDYEGLTGSAWMLTWGRQHDEAALDALASRWKVETFCIGHQSVPEGVRIDGARLVVINSDHPRGVAVPWDLSTRPTPGEIESRAIFLQTVSLPAGGDP